MTMDYANLRWNGKRIVSVSFFNNGEFDRSAQTGDYLRFGLIWLSRGDSDTFTNYFKAYAYSLKQKGEAVYVKLEEEPKGEK